MISKVTFEETTFNELPYKFEAGTPDISGAIGLHAAMDYLDQIGRKRIAHHDQELGAYAYAQLSRLNTGIRLFGPHIGRAGVVSFLLRDVHAHDVVTLADQQGVAGVDQGAGELLGQPDLLIELADRQKPRVAGQLRRPGLDHDRLGGETLE